MRPIARAPQSPANLPDIPAPSGANTNPFAAAPASPNAPLVLETSKVAVAPQPTPTTTIIPSSTAALSTSSAAPTATQSAAPRHAASNNASKIAAIVLPIVFGLLIIPLGFMLYRSHQMKRTARQGRRLSRTASSGSSRKRPLSKERATVTEIEMAEPKASISSASTVAEQKPPRPNSMGLFNFGFGQAPVPNASTHPGLPSASNLQYGAQALQPGRPQPGARPSTSTPSRQANVPQFTRQPTVARKAPPNIRSMSSEPSSVYLTDELPLHPTPADLRAQRPRPAPPAAFAPLQNIGTHSRNASRSGPSATRIPDSPPQIPPRAQGPAPTPASKVPGRPGSYLPRIPLGGLGFSPRFSFFDNGASDVPQMQDPKLDPDPQTLHTSSQPTTHPGLAGVTPQILHATSQPTTLPGVTSEPRSTPQHGQLNTLHRGPTFPTPPAISEEKTLPRVQRGHRERQSRHSDVSALSDDVELDPRQSRPSPVASAIYTFADGPFHS